MTPTLRAFLSSDASAGAVADRWARRFGLSVRIRLADTSVAPPCRLPRGLATFETRHGPLTLAMPAHLLTALVPAVLGQPLRPLGPVAPSASELGLFGYLALESTAALPALDAALSAVSVATASPFPRGDEALVRWRVELGTLAGIVEWGVPVPPPCAAHVPIACRLVAPWPPDVDLTRGGRIAVAASPIEAVTGAGPLLRLGWARADGPDPAVRFTVLPTPAEVTMTVPPESLPCTLTLDLGSLVMPAGVVAALRPGDRLPVSLPVPTGIWIRAGDVLVAEARLVAGADGFGIEVTRVLLPPG